MPACRGCRELCRACPQPRRERAGPPRPLPVLGGTAGLCRNRAAPPTPPGMIQGLSYRRPEHGARSVSPASRGFSLLAGFGHWIRLGVKV